MQEVDRYNILLKLIHSSMDNLKKAIKGLVVMSEALEEVYVSFTNNQVPKMWSKKGYNSLKSLGSWIRDLILRLDFIKVGNCNLSDTIFIVSCRLGSNTVPLFPTGSRASTSLKVS